MRMSTPHTAGALSNLKTMLRRLDIELPEDVATTLSAAPEPIEAPTNSEIAAAISAAVTAGKDPSGDKAVGALLTRERLAQPRYANEIAAATTEARRVAVVAIAGGIVDALGVVVDLANDEIQAAVKRNPTEHDRRNDEPLIALALERVDLAVKAWQTLAGLAGVRRLNVETKVLILAAPHRDEVHPGTHDAMTPARLGRPLELATFETFADRVDERLAMREQVAAEAERARRDAIHKAYGFGR